jgi:hypothetical protein
VSIFVSSMGRTTRTLNIWTDCASAAWATSVPWPPASSPSGTETVEHLVKRESPRRVHKCVVATLALESDPIDPRLYRRLFKPGK